MFDDEVLDNIGVTIFEFIKRSENEFDKVKKYADLPEFKKEIFRTLATDILGLVGDPDLDNDDDWLDDDDSW